MKNKVLTKVVASAVVLSTVATVSAFAGANLREIKAYLDYDVKIKYNLEEQTMLDENGARIYPISYNGDIYLPVTKLGEILDIDTKYDTEKNEVRLGITGDAVDFIDNYLPVYKSSSSNYHVTSADGKTIDIGGIKYNKYLKFYASKTGYNEVYKTYYSYDIGGKYNTLQFDIKSDANRDDSISILGDNDKLLYKISMKQGDSLKTIKVDVTGNSQIKIVSTSDTANTHYVYIVNAILQ